MKIKDADEHVYENQRARSVLSAGGGFRSASTDPAWSATNFWGHRFLRIGCPRLLTDIDALG
jgi:hypothetical protein